MVLADAVIHVNVGEFDLTWAQLTAVAVPLSGALTAIANKVINYLRERDAREAAMQQKLFDVSTQTALAEQRAVDALKSMAEKQKP